MRTIRLNLDSSTAQVIEQAASALGMSAADFILQTSLRRAIDVVGDKTTFYVDEATFDWFLDYLDNPPPPNEALIALLNRPAPWEEPHPE